MTRSPYISGYEHHGGAVCGFRGSSGFGLRWFLHLLDFMDLCPGSVFTYSYKALRGVLRILLQGSLGGVTALWFGELRFFTYVGLEIRDKGWGILHGT